MREELEDRMAAAQLDAGNELIVLLSCVSLWLSLWVLGFWMCWVAVFYEWSHCVARGSALGGLRAQVVGTWTWKHQSSFQ